MKINLEKIPEEGLRLQLVREENQLKELFEGCEKIDFSFSAPFSLDLTISKSKEEVFIQGEILGKLNLTCSRCLEEFLYPLESRFQYNFFPLKSQKMDCEIRLTREELEFSFYQGEEIDLSQIIQEQIALAIPFNPICTDFCRGLCPQCGINLNMRKCRCREEKVLDLRFAQLKGLLGKKMS